MARRENSRVDISIWLRHGYELMTKADQRPPASYPAGGRSPNSCTSFLRVRRAGALAIVVGTLMSMLSVAAPAGAATSQDEQVLAGQLFVQLNNERAARSLPALTLDSSLNTATRRWAERLENDGQLSHSSDGRAEIVAYGGNTGQITDAWMRSSGHRNLITDPNLVPASVAVTCDRDGRMWAVVQFRRLDVTKAVRSSSPSLPRETSASVGGSCGEPLRGVSGATVNAIKRLYKAYYLRDADNGGLTYWRNQAAAGMSIWRISDHFAGAREFQDRYGSLSDRQFIGLVYRNVMGRNPDAGGERYWIDRLRAGTTRGELMTYFSDSPEYRDRSGIR